MMRRAVVITGLVRDPDRFGAYLDGIRALGRRDLRVIFSTWTGELDRYPTIPPRLAALSADIAEQAPPTLKLPGHILHQVMTQERGLSLLEDDVFVLKTRPDISGLMDVHEFLDLAPERAPEGRLATPFRHRVHVVGLFGAHPTYINDIIFAGMAGDLRKLCQIPFVFGPKYPRLAPEQWIWGTALAAGNPVLDAFLSVNPGLIFDDPAGNATLRSVLAGSALFARAVAVMAIVTRDSLAFFHPDPHRAAIAASCAAHSLEALLWERLPMTAVDHHPSAETNTFLSAGLMDAVHDGLYRPSAFGARVAAAMARYGGPGGRAAMDGDRVMLAGEARDLAAALEARVGIGPGGDAPWSLMRTGSDYVAGLEDQVNRLRRMVDALQARLASGAGDHPKPGGGRDPA